jgi:hypothetical protein
MTNSIPRLAAAGKDQRSRGVGSLVLLANALRAGDGSRSGGFVAWARRLDASRLIVRDREASRRGIRLTGDMKATFAKIVGSAIALPALGAICIMGVRAQPTAGNLRSSALTTNWVGYLVAGQSDTIDRMTPNPSPTIVRRVEIGLRGDGVVIWRNAIQQK